MPRFVGDLVVKRLDERYWMLERPFGYQDTAVVVTVPEGFITDFASIPLPLQAFLKPDDPRFVEASVIHDRLYETHEVSKVQADNTFYRAMRIRHTPDDLRLVIWEAVHVFGQPHYDDAPARQAERRAIYFAGSTKPCVS